MDTKWNCDLALRVIALRALSPDSWTYMYGTIYEIAWGGWVRVRVSCRVHVLYL